MWDAMQLLQVLYVDWDSYVAPLSAPPLDLLILQWPRKALYIQSANNLNAGAYC